MDFYVSTQGSDANTGSIDAPFATLEQARDAMRQVKASTEMPKEGITVYLREGEYLLKQSFELTKEDSGVEHCPIVYCAYPGEEVRIIGGVKLDAADFCAVTNPEIKQRLPCGGSKVLELDLKKAGVQDSGDIKHYGFGYPRVVAPAELFVDDQVMMIARWPNTDMITIGAVDDPGPNPRKGDQPNRGAIFEFLDDRPTKWKDPQEAWMFGYWYHDWADGNLQIASIDAESRRIETVQPSFYSVQSGQRYYYYNILEELDAEGEWYIDRASQLLYIYPPADFDQSRIVLSQLENPLMVMKDVSYLTMKGFTYEASRGSGVIIQDGAENVITGCHFLNLGKFAVEIDGGYHHGVTHNRIYNTGIGGIRLAGGDRQSLVPGEHYVTDNEISSYSRLGKTYSPAVDVYGVGHLVAQNEIYDAPHMGIRIHGNDHVVEFNDIHDILKETSDAGAIYMGRDWTYQGNVIRYNYLYNLRGIAQGYGQMGIYLDDLVGDTLIYGNIIRDANHGMYIGGGRGNQIVNNMILECDHSIYYDARGLSNNWKRSCSEGGTMVRNLKAMPYQKEPWRSRYPHLTNILEDRPGAPLYNILQYNVVYKSPEPDLDPIMIAEATIECNWLTDSDPGFRNLADDDLTLDKHAPIFNEIPEFIAIPFDQIGRRISSCIV